MNEGWKCPECGTCYAPWVPKCDMCKGNTLQWIPSPIVIQECEHIWGEPGTSAFGVTCEKCGQLQNGPQPFTITTTDGGINGND